MTDTVPAIRAADVLSRAYVTREQRGLLYTFSGIEGAGKSTLVRQFVSQLERIDAKPAVIWSRPGYTPGLSLLKRIVRRTRASRRVVRHEYPLRSGSFRSPLMRRVWLIASLLDLLWVYCVRVRWYMSKGCLVVCDRYVADAHIDMLTYYPEDRVESWMLWRLLERFAPQPTQQFMVLVPLEVSLTRHIGRGGSIEDVAAIFAQRLTRYQSLAESEPITVLDGSKPLGENLSLVHSLIEAQNVE